MNNDDSSIYDDLTEAIKERLLELDTNELKPDKIDNTIEDIAVFTADKFLELLSQDIDWEKLLSEDYKTHKEFENIPILKNNNKNNKRKNIFYKNKN